MTLLWSAQLQGLEMDTDEGLESFATDLQQEIIATAEIEGDERLHSEAFTQLLLGELIEAGEIDDGTACYYRARGVEVSGYGFGFGGEILDLFVTIYRGMVPPASVSNTEAEI